MLNESEKNLKNILLNTIERPSSKQALEIKEEEMIDVAKEIGYEFSFEVMKKICDVHEAFMPIIEGGLISMLSETEKKEPDYYVFARDGELIFDALWGIGQAREKGLSERVHYLKTSLGMCDNKNNLKYLKEIGINKSRFEKGRLMVFIDSGFRGSLFRYVGQWAGYKKDLSNKNLQGYLMRKTPNSPFNQIDLKLNSKNKIDINNVMKNSPYSHHSDEDLNFMTCAFMQLMPKFTGRYVKAYEKEDGSWDVLPEQNSLTEDLMSKLNIKGKNFNSNLNSQSRNSSQHSSIKLIASYINEDIVNSLASLLLQKRTLDYFTDPNVHDRIYDQSKKTVSKGIHSFIKSFF